MATGFFNAPTAIGNSGTFVTDTVVTSTEAPLLSVLRPELRGDLEAVVAKALEKAKVAFIGPGIKAIGAMGDKIESKKLAHEAGVVLEVLGGELVEQGLLVEDTARLARLDEAAVG